MLSVSEKLGVEFYVNDLHRETSSEVLVVLRVGATLHVVEALYVQCQRMCANQASDG